MNLLITGAWQGYNDEIKTEIEAKGHKIVFLQWEKDPLPVEPEWVEGIIGNGVFLSHPIEEFTNLRYIQLTSAGFDRVPMDYVTEKNIEIHNARGVYSIPMAEFTLAGVFSLYKDMNTFRKQQEEKTWIKLRGIQELYGKTVLIAGCGSVGTECAKRFQAFGCEVIGVDQMIRKDEAYVYITTMDHLDEELKKADVVVLTLPLTKETKHLFDEDKFGIMKETAILANIARGAVVDTEAMIDALQNRSIAGAVLDVFEEEPLNAESPLWDFDNVILTPHNSFVGGGNKERLNQVILNNIKHK